MATTNTELINKIPTGKGVSPAQQIHSYLNSMKGEIARALPKNMTADRMARVALTEIRTNPKLLSCDIQSLAGAIMKASQEGLEFGTGDAYLVPYGSQVQYIRGYRGSLKLIRRSGEINNIAAYPVYAKDTFDIDLGTSPKVTHKPSLDADRGSLIGFYCVADVKGEGTYIEYMSIAEIEAIRKRSKAANNGPWVTDFVEMGRKTVLKRASKYLPMAIEMAQAIQDDEKKEFGDDSLIELNLGELPESKDPTNVENKDNEE